MDLTCALIIGGEPIETQFLAILQNPDILIGTPGRILHILTEMSLKLNLVETVIIDEADRFILFSVYEMGLLDELKSIISLTAKNHQIILISATLPKSLIHFSSLEMSDPQFIRLDIDGKLSNKLKLCNIYVKTEQKICFFFKYSYLATLIYLLTKYINESQQTLIFTSSHFHVDMLCEVTHGS
ncbi:hypothetical protein HZS_4864 [Henneguya salminicola]|nr:hypothetical protein HZS_4864 [Henneguya salminicola]